LGQKQNKQTNKQLEPDANIVPRKKQNPKTPFLSLFTGKTHQLFLATLVSKPVSANDSSDFFIIESFSTNSFCVGFFSF